MVLREVCILLPAIPSLLILASGFSSSSSHCSDLQPHGYQHSQGLDFGPILDTSYGFHPVPSSASDMHPPHSNDLDFMSWLQNDSPAGPVIPEPPEQIMCRIMDDVGNRCMSDSVD